MIYLETFINGKPILVGYSSDLNIAAIKKKFLSLNKRFEAKEKKVREGFKNKLVSFKEE